MPPWLHRGTTKDKWDVIDGTGTVVASGTGKSSYGQGVHGISVGDVNGDGLDDICTGSATIGADGQLLCSTGYGHGDAIHLADLVPDRPGLEIMMPHEESPFGYDVHDATTGEVLAYATSSKDNGRGLACDFVPSQSSKPDTNFRIYWTGDPFDQTFDGRYDTGSEMCSPRIRAWNTSSKGIVTVQEFADYGQPQTSNTTKATPCLQADFLGDWREELIMWQYEGDWSSPTCTLMIFSTPQETEYKVPCLLEDHQYRMAVAWQNASYNQPPHLSYSLAESLGIDRATYKTNVTSTAPDATPVEPASGGEETVKIPAADKGIVVGTCYTAGENGELTASEKDGYIKMRTGNNGNTITITVNEGYVVTGIYIEGYSNNTSTAADRSITMTGVYVDGSTNSEIASSVVFPGGTAGQNPVSANVTGFEASKNIVLKFDNSNIVSSEEDSAGKNKQLFAKIVLTYKKADASGISSVKTWQETSGQTFDLQGRRVDRMSRGIYIKDGRKILK